MTGYMCSKNSDIEVPFRREGSDFGEGMHVLQKLRYEEEMQGHMVALFIFLLNGSHNTLIHRMCNSEVQCLFGQ